MSETYAESQPMEEVHVNNTKITILGTAHVSKASADAVSELIETDQFDTIAIELCDSRYKSIVNPNSLTDMDLFEVIKTKKSELESAWNEVSTRLYQSSETEKPDDGPEDVDYEEVK